MRGPKNPMRTQLPDPDMLKSRHHALLSLRLRFHDEARLGPGKIALLEAVRTSRSVAKAGASMDMSARRAWLLIDSLNNAFVEPLVALSDPAQPGASEATLTQLGEELVGAYRAVEDDAAQSVKRRFTALQERLRRPPDQP